MIHGVFFFPAIRVVARKRAQYRRQFQMDQLVNHRELHVIQHVVERHLVLGRVQYADYRGLFVRVPVDVSQGLGFELVGVNHGHRHRPILKVETLLPEPQLFVGEGGREHRALAGMFIDCGGISREKTAGRCQQEEDGE